MSPHLLSLPENNKPNGGDDDECEELDEGDEGVEVGGDLCGGGVEEGNEDENDCGHQLD